MNVIVPVFTVAAGGYVVGRWRRISPGPLSQVVLYLLSPALAFNALVRRPIPAGDAIGIAAFVFLLAAIMFVITWLVCKSLHLGSTDSRAMLLSVLFMNAGNFGLSISYLAYGDAGLQKSLLFFVIQTILNGTLGVLIASSGKGDLREALKSVLASPVAYAGLSAVILTWLGIPIPGPIRTSVAFLADAAIPGMLVVLGLQLAAAAKVENAGGIAVATVLKLIVTIGVAFGLVRVLGLDGITGTILIVQASMPTAVFTVILATEFDANPRFVTSAVLVTTLVSMVTLTVLLSILGVG